MDQGCPLSPALFAIAIAPALAGLRAALRARDPDAELWSYLDDIYVQVDPALAEWAVSLADTTFAPLGLDLRRDKTQVWCPDPAVAVAHGLQTGSPLTCLGSPVPFVRASGTHRIAVALPGGALGKALEAYRGYAAQLAALHEAGLSLHCTLGLLRTYSDGAITHLQRATLVDAAPSAASGTSWSSALSSAWSIASSLTRTGTSCSCR